MKIGDSLFVQIVISQGYASQKDVEECLKLKENSQEDKPIEKIMLEKGFITKDHILFVYDILKSEVAGKTEMWEKSENNQATEIITSKDISTAKSSNSKGNKSDISVQIKSPGEKIGRYEIIELIGKGGMGVVYKAQDILLKRIVAAKLLLKPMNQENDNLLKRFLIEAQTVANLSHSNIVALYDIGQLTENDFFLIMEYIDGESLESLIQRKKSLSISETLDIIKQVSNALHIAHKKGIIHRDIKPANILITREGIPKVTDFGLAKVTTCGSISLTGQVLGTPHYISPEQIEAKEIDGRADIYSLGITMYKMLTGRLPFSGDNIYNIIMSHLNKEPEPPSIFNKDISPALENILNCMIAKNKNDRFQDAGILSNTITKFMQGDQTLENINFKEIKKEAEKKEEADNIKKKEETINKDKKVVSAKKTGKKSFIKKIFYFVFILSILSTVTYFYLPPQKQKLVKEKTKLLIAKIKKLNIDIKINNLKNKIKKLAKETFKDDNKTKSEDSNKTKVDERQANKDNNKTKVDEQQANKDNNKTKVDEQQANKDNNKTKVNGQQADKDNNKTKVDEQQVNKDDNKTKIEKQNISVKIVGNIKKDYPKLEKFSPKYIRLNGKKIDNLTLKPGKYLLELYEPGFHRIKKEIIITDKKPFFIIDEILKVKERKVILECKSARKLKTLEAEFLFNSIIASNSGFKKFKNGSMLKPGRYIFKIKAPKHKSKDFFLKLKPDDKHYNIVILLDRASNRFSVELVYDINPPEKSKLPVFTALYKDGKKKKIDARIRHKKFRFFLHDDIKSLEISQEGYFPVILKSFKGNIVKLESKPRKLSKQVLNTNLKKQVSIQNLFIDGKKVTHPIKLKPGKKVKVRFEFKNFEAVEKTIELTPGEKEWIPELELTPLNYYKIIIKDNPTINSNFKLLLDNKIIDENKYSIIETEQNIKSCSIWLSEKAKVLKITKGFYYTDIYLPVKFKTMVILDRISFGKLKEHIKSLGNEKKYHELLILFDGLSKSKEFLKFLSGNAHLKRKLYINIAGIPGDQKLKDEIIARIFGERTPENFPKSDWNKIKNKYKATNLNKVNSLGTFVYTGINSQNSLEYKHKKSNLIFVLIPAGSFEMGASPGDPYNSEKENPRFKVTLSAFLMAKYEINQRTWRKFMRIRILSWPKGANLPAINVPWKEANKFCKKLGFSLPTEAQWEYACRAGTKTAYYWGETFSDSYACCNKKFPKECGSLKPNNYGLYDMSGNVSEWCLDAFYSYTSTPKTDPVNKAKSFFTVSRVLRGGSFRDYSVKVRSSSREFYFENYRSFTGVRPVVNINKQELRSSKNIQELQGFQNYKNIVSLL